MKTTSTIPANILSKLPTGDCVQDEIIDELYYRLRTADSWRFDEYFYSYGEDDECLEIEVKGWLSEEGDISIDSMDITYMDENGTVYDYDEEVNIFAIQDEVSERLAYDFAEAIALAETEEMLRYDF